MTTEGNMNFWQRISGRLPEPQGGGALAQMLRSQPWQGLPPQQLAPLTPWQPPAQQPPVRIQRPSLRPPLWARGIFTQ